MRIKTRSFTLHALVSGVVLAFATAVMAAVGHGIWLMIHHTFGVIALLAVSVAIGTAMAWERYREDQKRGRSPFFTKP